MTLNPVFEAIETLNEISEKARKKSEDIRIRFQHENDITGAEFECQYYVYQQAKKGNPPGA